MSPLPEMQEVERRLPDALNEVTDRKGDNLLRREGGSVALLPEASRLLGRRVTGALDRFAISPES